LNLTLRMRATAPGMRPPDASRQVFTEKGGTIGRATNNTWVLPDKKVSGRHAVISFADGVFYIQDTSSNGVSVNGPKNRLVRDRPYALREGDRIFIEPYEIEAGIDTGATRSPFAASGFERGPVDPLDDLFTGDDPFAPVSGPLIQAAGPVPAPHAGDVVDPLAFFDPVGPPPSPRKPEPIPSPSDDLLAEHYRPPVAHPDPLPQPGASGGEAAPPPGWNPLSEDSGIGVKVPIEPVRRPKLKERPPREVPAPPPVTAPSLPEPPLPEAPAPPQPAAIPPPAAAASRDLSQVLAGAGVPDAQVTPELARGLGEILQVVVTGLMDVLQSRQHIKGEFGLDHTMFRPKGNNPLKFSANAADALHNLLVKRNAAYLGPVDAFAEAFDDLRDHQLAMLAGMRRAFQSMLDTFDPDRLQEEFDRQIAKVSLPLIPGKLRYWDLFRDKRRELMKDPDAAFDRLFGEEFARAYDEQFQELRKQRRARAAEEAKEPRQPPN
jgi:type VI secretion system FHA domain protein